MIGFQSAPLSERSHLSEDPETANLDKKELYNMISHKYYLPPYHGKGVTREYLIKVHKEQCYRVPLMTLKHFEVELTPAMTKRVGVQNNALLLRKLNILLRSRGCHELGFEDFDPPEEVQYVH